MRATAIESLSNGYGPGGMHDFRILGPLEVEDDNRPVRLGGPKQRSTLAILLLNANRVVPVERLADDLYAGAAPVTAVTQVQRQISELRKVLRSPDLIETRAPGYVIHLSPEQLDLARFEAGAEEASRALSRGEAQRASDLLREALAVWRGAPMVDFAYEPFAKSAILRLEEIRLVALEQRIDADLALGRQASLIGELEELVREHPLREALRAQLMLAYYRSGRQVDALETYSRTRDMLVSGFGIEPTPSLQLLERAVLNQDSSLDLVSTATVSVSHESRSVLVVPATDEALDRLLVIGDPLAALPGRELIVAQLVDDEAMLGPVVEALNERRAATRVPMRTAAFTTDDHAADAVRLAISHNVELLLMDIEGEVREGNIQKSLALTLEHSPADVGALHGAPMPLGASSAIFVPFGGSEHDWAALELSAWLGLATGARIRLVGLKADRGGGRRDSSRLLADASLAVQQLVGVETEPVLAGPGAEALVTSIQPAALVVMGFSSRWRHEGIGPACQALLGSSTAVLLVHRGLRPSGLAPRESRTRFTWSL
jgi:DNA-binding SARP family transcriptional activator